jgi:epoxyqueuosine reductase
MKVLRRKLFDSVALRFLEIALIEPVYERLRYLPRLPPMLRRRRFELGRRFPRQRVPSIAPAALQTMPGPLRDEDAAWAAYEQGPLRNFWVTYREAERWIFRQWSFILPALPRYLRGEALLKTVAQAEPRSTPGEQTPEQLSALIRAEAARLGLTSIGITAYDPRYTYAEDAGNHDEGSVIMCVVESDYDDELTVPSRQNERMLFELYIQQFDMIAKLATFVQDLGYRAQPQNAEGPFMYVPYGAQAGLGQMGYNGQLLTPGAGARVSLMAITTNAELGHDAPVDYGIPSVCAECKVCVRRCPVGAIPSTPSVHRGVTKTKIKTERCLPVVGQTDGCAICVKVCPIQRFGLEAVIGHYEQTGGILGKDSDDLEGYTWPLNEQYYGANTKPRINSARLLAPDGLVFDKELLYRPFPDADIVDTYINSQ